MKEKIRKTKNYSSNDNKKRVEQKAETKRTRSTLRGTKSHPSHTYRKKERRRGSSVPQTEHSTASLLKSPSSPVQHAERNKKKERKNRRAETTQRKNNNNHKKRKLAVSSMERCAKKTEVKERETTG
jgi:hypothetical protein